MGTYNECFTVQEKLSPLSLSPSALFIFLFSLKEKPTAVDFIFTVLKSGPLCFFFFNYLLFVSLSPPPLLVALDSQMAPVLTCGAHGAVFCLFQLSSSFLEPLISSHGTIPGSICSFLI